MKRGAIFEAIRQEIRTAVLASAILTGLFGAVLALNWKYMYNFAAGPFPFDSDAGQGGSVREFVRAEGPLLPTGLQEQTRVRLLRGLVESESVSAKYMALLTGSRLLLVKMKPEFSGRVVEGRLVPLPEAVRAEIATAEERREGRSPLFYPVLLEQGSYRLDANLFVMIATPLFALSLLLLAYNLTRVLRPSGHPVLARLASRGPLPEVLARVENAFALEGSRAKAGPLWLTRDWVASLGDKVFVSPTADLAAIGAAVSLEKQGGKPVVKHEIRIWTAECLTPVALSVSAAEAEAVRAAARDRIRWAWIDDVPGYERRWRENRQACVDEATRSRQAPFAPAPTTPS